MAQQQKLDKAAQEALAEAEDEYQDWAANKISALDIVRKKLSLKEVVTKYVQHRLSEPVAAKKALNATANALQGRAYVLYWWARLIGKLIIPAALAAAVYYGNVLWIVTLSVILLASAFRAVKYALIGFGTFFLTRYPEPLLLIPGLGGVFVGLTNPSVQLSSLGWLAAIFFIGLLGVISAIRWSIVGAKAGWNALLVKVGRRARPAAAVVDTAPEPQVSKLAQTTYETTVQVMMDYYAPLNAFKTAPPARSQYSTVARYTRALDEYEQNLNDQREEAVRSHILSVEEKEAKEVVVTLRTRLGSKDEDLLAFAPILTSAYGAYGVEEERLDQAPAGTVGFRFFFTAPVNLYAKPFTYPAEPNNTFNSVAFGMGARKGEIRLDFEETNYLIGGNPGGGKSGSMTSILVGLAPLPGLAIVGFDAKYGVELGLWKNRLTALAKSVEEGQAMMPLLLAEMKRRYEFMEARGWKKISYEYGRNNPGFETIVLIIDELAEFTNAATTKPERDAQSVFLTQLRRLIQLGRAAGIPVITATQRPAAEIVPTPIRDLIQRRIAHATTTSSSTDIILGPGATSNGGLSHTIPTSAEGKGVFYFIGDGERIPKLGRTYWVPDEQVASIANASASRRVHLPFLEDFNRSDNVIVTQEVPSTTGASAVEVKGVGRVLTPPVHPTMTQEEYLRYLPEGVEPPAEFYDLPLDDEDREARSQPTAADPAPLIDTEGDDDYPEVDMNSLLAQWNEEPTRD